MDPHPLPLVMIRPASLADLATLVEFNLHLAWETEALRLNPEVLRPGVAAVLADPHKGRYFLAVEPAQPESILGQTLLTYEWSDWRNGFFWWIQSVYVVQSARRRGVFRALYHHIQALATADPTVIGLRLYVESQNQKAQATYRSLGMELEPYQMLARYPLPGRPSHVAHG